MFENVIEAMVDAVLVVDAAGIITATNTAAARMTGHPTLALRGMPYGRLLLEESSDVRATAIRQMAKGEAARNEQSWLLTATGERIPVSVTGSPVVDPAGHVESIVIVARDVRELRTVIAQKDAELKGRRIAEAELRAVNASIEVRLDEARSSLLLAERRATLGTLAGGVGHELRNIAQVQLAIVEELRTALETDGDVAALVRELLPDLSRATEHITAHGQRLLQLARPEPDVVDDVSLSDVAGNVLAMMRGSGKLRHVQLDIDLPASPALTVLASRTRIEQILVNLVVNAIDAIGGHTGTVTIRARPSPDGSRVLCEVADSGPGISQDDREHIFEPFFTTKPPDQGTGLGLPVAKEIVASYGGTLAMTTSASGTTFTFDLPH